MAASVEREYAAAADAFVRQAGAIHHWLDQLADAEWSAPSVLPGWDVATLAAHILLMQRGLVARLAQTQSVAAMSVADYVGVYRDVASDIDGLTRSVRAEHELPELLAALKATSDPREALAQVAPVDVVSIPGRGALKVVDWLLSRLLELAVHSDDLSRSLPERPPLPLEREVLARSCRLLLQILTSRAPGKSVEVRVPPFAAAQVIAGPGHTRGTPPNVVEMSPLSWIRLATGRLDWDELTSSSDIRFSGSRAALIADYCPLLG